MPANYLGFSLAESLQDAENIKTSKQNRQINQLKMDQIESDKNRNNMLTGIRGKAVTGDRDAINQLLTLAPEEGAQFIESLGKMDERQREIKKANNEGLGRMSAQVLTAPPEKRPQLYQQMLSQLPPEIASKAPPEYNENWMKMSMARVRAIDEILSNPQSVSLGGQDVLYRDGQEIERADKPVRQGDVGSGKELKATDSRLFFKLAVESLGGILDEDGNIRGLGPEDSAKATAMHADVERRWLDNPNMTPAEAFRDVAREYGLRIPTSTQARDPSDPDAIREALIGNSNRRESIR